MKRTFLWSLGLLVLAGCADAAAGGDHGGLPDASHDPNPPDPDPDPVADASVPVDPDGGPDSDGGGPVVPPVERGATMPWDEYEAEAMATNGTLLGPSTTPGDVAAESSGRRAVRLDDTGDYVELTAARAANSIVVRYVIPDAPGGGGIDATLNVYVDGAKRASLPLTSRYAWAYGLPSWLNGGPDYPAETPATGGAFHFYDESRALVGDIPAGATVRLQVDAENTADYYVVDLVDLEQVAPPLDRPAGFLSVVDDCGATADDDTDDGAKIQDCVNRVAGGEGEGVWIPAGTFEVAYDGSRDMGIMVSGVTVQGAGMWHSVLHGAGAGFYCSGNDCRFADFAVFGDTTTRTGQKRDNGFNGSAGSGSRLDRIWVEHRAVGFWVGLDSPPNGPTDGLVISQCRFRNLFADGVNFCNGTSHSEVVDSHFRYTGDDAIASWSYTSPGAVNTGNVFRFNTVQLPWRANCFAIYGGADNAIEDNVCADTLTFPGIQVGGPYQQAAFAGTTRVERNTLIRAGGTSFDQAHGALKLFAYQVDMTGVVVRDVEILSPTFHGIDFQSWGADASRIVDASLERVTVTSPGAYGIHVRSDARGRVTMSGVTVTDPGAGGLLDDDMADQLTLERGEGNAGF